jgi:preprotein translocase SecE subunit
MATAVQTSSEPRTPNPRTRRVLASVAGALVVAAAVAVAAYLLPLLWGRAVAEQFGALGVFIDLALRIVALVAVGVLVGVAAKQAWPNPPHGVRGGIFLVLSGLIAIFFVVRAFGLNLEDSPVGMPVALGVLVVLLVAFYRFLMSDRAERWMTALEEQGWFHTFHYKRTQGLRARRYTMIGILVIGWTGAYSAYKHETFGRGPWDLKLPFDLGSVTLLSSLEYAAPLLVAVLVFWFAWRTVNLPQFADFLVATEAEMNKVSWSSRRRLVQDTIVVLVTCLLLTAFLLVVDLFWGWLLSRSFIGVLPPRSTATEQVDPNRGKPAHW